MNQNKQTDQTPVLTGTMLVFFLKAWIVHDEQGGEHFDQLADQVEPDDPAQPDYLEDNDSVFWDDKW